MFENKYFQYHIPKKKIMFITIKIFIFFKNLLNQLYYFYFNVETKL